MKQYLPLLPAAVLMLVSSCIKSYDPVPTPTIKLALSEDFEQGTKAAYATGTVYLKTGPG